MTPTFDPSATTQNLKDLKNLVNNLLILLSPKEKHIIENRFALNNNSQATLEKIGKEFGVTRERIRQIEKNAMRKLQRNVVNTALHQINQLGAAVIAKYEGVVLEEKLINEVLLMSQEPQTVDTSSIKLSLELDQNLEKLHNTIHLRPHWKLKSIPRSDILEICEKTIAFLSKKGEVSPIEEIAQHLQTATGKRVSPKRVHTCLELDRRIKVVKHGIGLSSWRNINPKTLRDKIHFILRLVGKPMHFVEISNRITESHFDSKNVNVQAVHNELIRCEHFVLIGRGIYALKDWGYEDGTVADIIADVLKKNGPLLKEQVVDEVLKQRQVKRITILLNLKNKSLFVKNDKTQYALKK